MSFKFVPLFFTQIIYFFFYSYAKIHDFLKQSSVNPDKYVYVNHTQIHIPKYPKVTEKNQRFEGMDKRLETVLTKFH